MTGPARLRPAPVEDDARCDQCGGPAQYTGRCGGTHGSLCGTCYKRWQRTGTARLGRPPHWPAPLDARTVELDAAGERRRAQVRALLEGVW